jgi:hypothetical protein
LAILLTCHMQNGICRKLHIINNLFIGIFVLYVSFCIFVSFYLSHFVYLLRFICLIFHTYHWRLYIANVVYLFCITGAFFTNASSTIYFIYGYSCLFYLLLNYFCLILYCWHVVYCGLFIFWCNALCHCQKVKQKCYASRK